METTPQTRSRPRPPTGAGRSGAGTKTVRAARAPSGTGRDGGSRPGLAPAGRPPAGSGSGGASGIGAKTGRPPAAARRAAEARTAVAPGGSRRAAAVPARGSRPRPVRARAPQAGPATSGRSAGLAVGSPAAPQSAIRVAGLAMPRMSFVLLVLALLGGGLICLLVINTTLGASSFRISQLQTRNASLSLQEQSLQGQIQDEEGPAEIAKRAAQLGMRAETDIDLLDLRTHRIYRVTGQAGSTASPPITTTPTRPVRHRARHKRSAGPTVTARRDAPAGLPTTGAQRAHTGTGASR